MGNTKDGNNSKHNIEKIFAYGEDAVKIYGNEDAKTLTKVFKNLSKDGLTDSEIKVLNELDKELKHADFSCLSSDATLVIQKENATETDFLLLGNGMTQNTGFINGKHGRSK